MVIFFARWVKFSDWVVARNLFGFARPLFHKELMLQKQIPSVQSFSAFHFFSRVALTLLLESDRLRN
jgi:hypothetical protein